MKKILFSLVVLTFASSLFAQTEDNVKKPALAIRVSAFDFTTARAIQVSTLGGAYSNKSWANFSDLNKSIGVQYFKGISKKVDFMINLDFARMAYPFYASSGVKDAWPSSTGLDKERIYTAIDANLNFKLLPDDYKLVPYLTAGLGVGNFATNYMAYAPVGFGLQIKAKHGSFININSSFRIEMSQLTKTHLNHGISYSFPLKLKDKKPVVLPPPPPPADSDNDGVIDENDKCPTVAGLAKYGGCPIPDTDKDGINDEQDKCPTVAGLTRYNGCPIPDTDKDGVNDEVDACPTEAGISANHGCPDVQPILTQAASNLKFVTGKSNLSKKQLTGLGTVIEMLNKYPNVNIAIGGHTDNTGAERINTKLSINRSKTVGKYLTKKGINANRFTASGYASSKPIANNKTKAGRAQNRRVELTAIYN